jgi:FAD dependent oxidoreductase TIGR03364
MKSLEFWLEVLASSGLWHSRTGSLHLAYREDEAQVLREFASESRDHGEPVHLLTHNQVSERTNAVKRDGLQLALWSQHEVCVDPREVIAALPEWLARHFGVEFMFEHAITAIESHEIIGGSSRWSAKRAWICSGDELNLLFPDQFRECGLARCKLQMMRSQAYGDSWRMGPMLAAGLTLRHYASFRNCPSLSSLCRRIADESPWFDRLGIHVLVSQNGCGELTIGDSHEYGDAIEPFDKVEIDEWILEYLKTFLDAPGLRITSRWQGTYVKHATSPYVVIEPATGVSAITGVGGAGMTLSFGLAEQVVGRRLGGSEA